MGDIAAHSQIVQIIQIIINRKFPHPAQPVENKLISDPLAAVFCKIPDDLLPASKFALIHAGAPQHVIKIFFSRRRIGKIHFFKDFIHIQVIPRNIIDMESVCVLQKIVGNIFKLYRAVFPLRQNTIIRIQTLCKLLF